MQVSYVYTRADEIPAADRDRPGTKKVTNIDPARVQQLPHELAMDEPGVQVPL